MIKILILNGPDLSATPSPEITAAAKTAGVEIDYRQTQNFDTIIEWMQKTDADAIIFNPAKDINASPDLYQRALNAIPQTDLPVTEVHLDNIYASDDGVPHANRTSDKTTGMICGLGDYGYVLAINAIAKKQGK